MQKCWYNDNKKKPEKSTKKNLIVEFKSCLEHRPLLHWAQLSLVVHPAHTAVFLERVRLFDFVLSHRRVPDRHPRTAVTAANGPNATLRRALPLVGLFELGRPETRKEPGHGVRLRRRHLPVTVR